jgi:hypothetical protein
MPSMTEKVSNDKSQSMTGAFRWIEDAVPKLKLLREKLVKEHTGMRSDDALSQTCDSCKPIIAIDEMLMGVPVPNVDLGFDSPADRAARAEQSATAPKLPEMFKWWRDRFDDIEDDARTLMKSAPQELHGAIEGIRVVAEQGRDGMERLSRGE